MHIQVVGEVHALLRKNVFSVVYKEETKKKSKRHPAAGSSLVSQHPGFSNPQNWAERCFAPYGCSLAHATVSWVAIAYPISSRTLQAWYPRNHSNPTCRHGRKRTSHSQPGYTHSSRRRPWSASLSPLHPCSFYQNPGRAPQRYGYISTALLPTEKSSCYYVVPKTSPTAITIEFEVAMIASRTVFHGWLVSCLGANNTSNGWTTNF